MFTGADGATPLAAWARTQKATRRIKFDRNKNVENDLTFWSRFLREGKETINIGDLHAHDLLLDTSFLTIEVADIKESA